MGVRGLGHASPALLSGTKSSVFSKGRWFLAAALNKGWKSRFHSHSNCRQSSVGSL